MTTPVADAYKLPKIVQGADWHLRITWYTQTNDDPRVAIDLTGYAALFQIRKTSLHPPAVSIANGSGITLGGAAGTIDLALTDVQTAGIWAGVYQYDLLMTDTSGDKRVILAGEVEIRARISR